MLKNRVIQILMALLISIVMISCGGKQQSADSSGDERPTPGYPITFSDTTHESFIVRWGEATDDVTSAANLQYRVVMADSYTKLNLVSRAVSIEGEGVIREWAPYTESVVVSGLSSEVVYWVNVIVRDEAGNQEIYAPSSVRTLESFAPMQGSSITFESTGSYSTDVQWGAATDKIYNSEELSYKLIASDESYKIDTLYEADKEADYDEFTFAVWGDWRIDTLSDTVIDLDDGKKYYFAVIVQNPAGAKALYTPRDITTVDVSAPEIKNPVLQFPHATADSITLSWAIAEDNLTPKEELQYLVVRADTEGQLGPYTPENLPAFIAGLSPCDELGGTCRVGNWAVDGISATAEGLEEWTDYYFTVVVKDVAGNMDMYGIASEQTLDGTAPDTSLCEVDFSEIGQVSMKIQWDEADDLISDPGALRYRLVKFRYDSPITHEEAETTEDPENLVFDWNYYVDLFGPDKDTPTEITGLVYNDPVRGEIIGIKYGFWILVKDEHDNVAHYAMADKTTLDGTNPWLPDVSDVTFSDITSSSATVNWNKAMDNLTPQDGLEYMVVRADSEEAIDPGADTLADWIAGLSVCGGTTGVCRVLENWSLNNSASADGLALRDESYYFAVIVRDAAGYTSLYPIGNMKTKRTWEYLGTHSFTTDYDSVSIGIRTETVGEVSHEVPYVAYIDNSAEYSYVAVVKYFNGMWSSVGNIASLKEPAISVDLEVGTDEKLYVAYTDMSGTGKVIVYSDVEEWNSVGTSIPSAFLIDMEFSTVPLVTYNNVYTSIVGNENLSAGWNWLASSDSFDIAVNGGDPVTITLDENCTLITDICDHINAGFAGALIDGVAAVVSGNYVEIRSDSGQMLVLSNGSSGAALDTLGISPGTYYAGKYRLVVEEYSAGVWTRLDDPLVENSNSPILGSVAIASGVPFVAYQGADNKISVKEYDETGAAWVAVGSEGFADADSAGRRIGMAVDGDGVPYVAYVDACNSDMKATVEYYNSTSWVPAFASGDVRFSSGAVDRITIDLYSHVDGETTIVEPYVAFSDDANSGKATVMRYGNTNSVWEVVGSPGFSSGSINFISLVMDADGRPHVAFRDSNGSLTVMVYK